MINDVNNEKRKESMIRGLGVFELRAVARQLGVPSPTTKKKGRPDCFNTRSFKKRKVY